MMILVMEESTGKRDGKEERLEGGRLEREKVEKEVDRREGRSRGRKKGRLKVR